MTTEETAMTETTQVPAMSMDNIPPELRTVLAQFGAVPADLGVAPTPTVTHKYSLDEVCILKTPIVDEHGEPIANVKGHSGPMIYLATAEESENTRKEFANKFSETRGFWVYTVWHFDLNLISRNYEPKTPGKIVVTHGIPKEGPPTELAQFIATLAVGNQFQVAAIGTSSGKRIFQPVKVQ